MKNFNQLTALNHQLQEDRSTVAQRRWQAVQRIELRHCRSEKRELKLSTALDILLVGSALFAIVAFAMCGI